MQSMLDAHPDCSIDRIDTEQRLTISHAFMRRYLFSEGNKEPGKIVENPSIDGAE